MITDTDIFTAFGGDPQRRMALCPAHNDRNTPNLSVKMENGKLLLYCHAGCSQQAVWNAVKERLNSKWGKSNGTTPMKIENVNDTEYEYETEPQKQARKFRHQAMPILLAAANENMAPEEYLHGRGIDQMPESLMYLPRKRARKLGAKIVGFIENFPAMVAPIIGPNGLQGALVTHLNRDGTKNLRDSETKKNIRKVYGQLKGGYIQLGNIDPKKPPKTLYAGEGIETALSPSQITKYRHPAIAVPGGNFVGISSPPPADELIILADNDESGIGLERAKAAGKLWAGKGRRVRIASPPAQYKDWNDAIRDRNADQEALRDRLLNAPLVDQEPDEEVRALTMAELLDRSFPPREHLLSPWLATGSLVMIHAQRGAGKTRFVMSAAYAVASGQPMLDWNVSRPVRVLYVDGELPATLLQQRVKVLGPETPNLRLLSRDILLREDRVTIPDLAESGGRAWLDEIIEREKADLIILNSLSTLIRSGEENTAESWAPVQDWLLDHRFHGRTVIIVHHEGKTKKQRGTSKREDVLDTIVSLEEVKDDMGSNEEQVTFELKFTKTREFYGAEAAPLLLRLSTKSGTAEWSFETKRDHVRDKIVELNKGGMKQKDIAKAVGLTQPQVSRILQKVKEEENSKT